MDEMKSIANHNGSAADPPLTPVTPTLRVPSPLNGERVRVRGETNPLSQQPTHALPEKSNTNVKC